MDRVMFASPQVLDVIRGSDTLYQVGVRDGLISVLKKLGIKSTTKFVDAALIAFIAVRMFVVPKEEDELIKRFGGEYREYQERTGRLAPRLPMPR